jgi:hypothetical protein
MKIQWFTDTNHACLRLPAGRQGRQGLGARYFLSGLGWIFSLSFRLSQGMLNIFSLQGCLQTIGFFPPLHKYLHDYGMMEFWNNGMMGGDLYYKQYILFFLSLNICPLFQHSNIPIAHLFDQPDS